MEGLNYVDQGRDSQELLGMKVGVPHSESLWGDRLVGLVLGSCQENGAACPRLSKLIEDCSKPSKMPLWDL